MAADMCPRWTGEGSNGNQGVGLGGHLEALVGSVSYDRTLKLWAPEDLPAIVAEGDEEMQDL